MKVLFLDPIHKVWEFFRGLTASPGLIMLSAVARRDFNVKVFDASMEFSGGPWNKTAEYLERERPDVVAITGTITSFWYDSLNAAKLVRDILPEAKIITGGYIAMQLWQSALQSGYFDYVVLGEGEITLLELLNELKTSGPKDFSKILGLAYLKDGKPVANEPRPFITDLDTLPLPAYDLFPMDRYSLAPFGGRIGYTVTFARGCQNRCVFCSEAKQWNNCWRGHGAEYMVETLTVLRKKFGKRVFYIGDDEFLHDRARTEKFISLMQKAKLDILMWIQTTCYSAVNNADLLKSLKEIGVFQIMLGIEMPNAKGLKSLNKPQNMDLVEKAIATITPHEFVLMGMLMWGAPWDTKADLYNALDFLMKKCDIVGPNASTPWPGTDYYAECEKLGAIEDFDLSRYDMTNVVTRTAELSAAASDRFYKNTVGKALMFNKKSLHDYLFSRKPLYRTYTNMFLKMGWRFFIMKPWIQKNYQEFDGFYRDFSARRISQPVLAKAIQK